MGQDKALLSHDGKPLILSLADRLSESCEEVLVCAKNAASYKALGLSTVRDLSGISAPLAGIHGGLCAAKKPWVFAIACDMPFFQPALLAALWAQAAEGNPQVICPESPRGLEPLFALYHRSAIPVIEKALAGADLQVSAFFSKVRTKVLLWEQVKKADPEGKSFLNWNRPDDLPRSPSLSIPGASR